ncbi:MAG TPA: permease-like cell division protein FtsX, partial [Acidimicrobiia bacterium]|nr:permease-like cell division protein FtsX [Acidimicrobiia bacterium]
MTDDRTEQRLRRALQNAAREVDAPMGTLPEGTLEPTPVRRRPRVPVPVALALALLLVAGSVALIAARDDSSTSVSIGAAGEPITADDTDIQLTMDVNATDDQIAGVRDFADASPEIAAYTYLTWQELLVEVRARLACAPGVADVTAQDGPSVFRFRVATVDDDQALERALVALPGVAEVTARFDGMTSVATATATPSGTAVVPTMPPTVVPGTGGATPTTLAPEPATTTPPTTLPEPATTTPPTTTVPPQEPPSTAPPSKEIPFVAPAPAQCTAPPSSDVVPRPMQTPAATLPPAGDPPADPAAAEQAIREMWAYTHDGSLPLEDRFRDHLEDADELLPLMKSIGQDGAVKSANILGIQFLSPTRAALLSQNVFQGGSLDVVQLQYVVLIDGQWKWTRETQC